MDNFLCSDFLHKLYICSLFNLPIPAGGTRFTKTLGGSLLTELARLMSILFIGDWISFAGTYSEPKSVALVPGVSDSDTSDDM